LNGSLTTKGFERETTKNNKCIDIGKLVIIPTPGYRAFAAY
jgi:hypothetical protein